MDMSQETYTIDAAGKRIGRVASEAAKVLMGKHRPDFAPNRVCDVHVVVTNAGQLQIDDKKRVQKHYSRYSGYPSGLKQESLNTVLERKGIDTVIRNAVYGMLPANRIRDARLKNLEVQE